MDYFVHLLAVTGFFALIAMSLDVVAGYAGVPTLGHAAYCLAGAYTSAILSSDPIGWPPLVGVLLGAGLATLLGLFGSLPALRVGGDFLALLTLGLGLIAQAIVENLEVTKGPSGFCGVPRFSIVGFEISSEWQWAVTVWGLVGITYWSLKRLLGRSFGRVLIAVRDDETAIQALGHKVGLAKIRAFAVGSFIAGTAAGLYVHFESFVAPQKFGVTTSVMLLLMIVSGGAGTLRGAVLGAVIFSWIPGTVILLPLPGAIQGPLEQLLYGVALILVVVFWPEGLGIGNRLRGFFKKVWF